MPHVLRYSPTHFSPPHHHLQLRIRSRLSRVSPRSLRNRLAQLLWPDKKIFVIGFNKCATSALDQFFRAQGIRSVHHSAAGASLAVEIEERVADPERLRAYLAQWTAYSDLTFSSHMIEIEANRHFREFHRLFPDAYFILNDRDPESWLASRLAHGDTVSFAERSMAAHNVDLEGLMRLWRERRDQHNDDVLAHFRGNEMFLHFMVDQDPISDVIELLAPHYSLSARHWRPVRVTAK